MTYHLNGKLVGIGVSESGEVQASVEAQKFADDTNWDKFASDKAYREARVKEGAQLAAAAGCTAAGAGAAAPLCAAVGGEIAAYATQLWNSAFGNSKEVAAAKKKRADTAYYFVGEDQARQLDNALADYLQATLIALAEFKHKLDGGYLSGADTFVDSTSKLRLLIDARGPCAALRGTAASPTQLYDELQTTTVSKYSYCTFKPGAAADMLGYFWERYEYYKNVKKQPKTTATDSALADTQKMAAYVSNIVERRASELMFRYTMNAANKTARKEAFAAAGGKQGSLKTRKASAGTKVAVALGIAAAATAGVVVAKKRKLRPNPPRAWLFGGLALAGVAGGAYLLLRGKSPEDETDGGQPAPATQATPMLSLTNLAPQAPQSAPVLSLTNLVVTQQPRCFSLAEMWEFSKSLPNHNLTYASVPMNQWGTPKDASKDVRYSPITCRFYMWSGSQWTENTMIQAKANAWS